MFYVHTERCTHTQTYLHAYTRMCANADLCTHASTFIEHGICMYVWLHLYTCVQVRIHVYTCIVHVGSSLCVCAPSCQFVYPSTNLSVLGLTG